MRMRLFIKCRHCTNASQAGVAYTNDNKITFMLEMAGGLRFCLEYDQEGGWIYIGEAAQHIGIHNINRNFT